MSGAVNGTGTAGTGPGREAGPEAGDNDPAADPGDVDLGGEIRLGSALFTLVEPHKGHEVEYHRWYERDHFYAGCMIGPWYFAGRRWVATHDLKDLRLGADALGGDATPLFGDDRAGSFLALYWTLAGRFRENTDWATRQVHWLHRNGRMYEHRDHVHTLLYRYRGEQRRHPDGVPPELALDHPFAGLAAVVIERSAEAGDDEPVPRWSPSPESPVALALTFTGVPLPPDAPVTQPGTDGVERRELHLWFADAEPAGWWHEVEAYAEEMATDGWGTVRWAAPFIPTIPGTDTYCDQLW